MTYTQQQVQQLVDERDNLLKTDRDNPRIDILADKIWIALNEYQDILPVDFIIESLTSLGAAPSILYDDNGHFTIGEDGIQNMPTFGDEHKTKETTFDGTWFVKPGRWKPTIREAIKDYFEDRE
jgi:hypothetical protein